MKKMIPMISMILAALVATVLGGCANSDGVGPQILDVVTDVILAGDATYAELDAIEQAAKREKESVAKPEAETPDCAPAPTKPATPSTPVAPAPAVVPASGKASAVILGSTSCGYTVRLMKMRPESAIETALPWVDVVDADVKKNAATWKKYRPREGFSYPLIRCYDAAGVHRGDLVARGMTIADVVAKVRALLPE